MFITLPKMILLIHYAVHNCKNKTKNSSTKKNPLNHHILGLSVCTRQEPTVHKGNDSANSAETLRLEKCLEK